jgi:hypothetical protein
LEKGEKLELEVEVDQRTLRSGEPMLKEMISSYPRTRARIAAC